VSGPEIDNPTLQSVGVGATGVPPRRGVVVVTLLVGTAVLAGTLAAPSGSALFYSLGLLAAAVWIAGGLLAGSVPWRRDDDARVRPAEVTLPILLGSVLFGTFFAAKLVADHVPVLAHDVGSILARADTGPRLAVLVVALVNGLGEEVFFRGVLQSSFERHPLPWTTGIYTLVTLATLNLALVAAAVVMGTIFSLERRASRSILAPILTHLTWSALIVLFLRP
jgi:membrane protease YdiL (CAAX protease family)